MDELILIHPRDLSTAEKERGMAIYPKTNTFYPGTVGKMEEDPQNTKWIEFHFDNEEQPNKIDTCRVL